MLRGHTQDISQKTWWFGGAHAGSNEIQGQEKKTPAAIKTSVSKVGKKSMKIITSDVLLSHKRTGRGQTEFYRGGWGGGLWKSGCDLRCGNPCRSEQSHKKC